MRPFIPVRAAAVGLLVVALSAASLQAQKADPILGTWKLNLAKSKFAPGTAPKSETRTYVADGQAIKASAQGADHEGKPTSAEWTLDYDGKPHPETGNPDADSLAVKRISPSTTEFTQTMGGKVVIRGRRTIAQDGKTMTITSKGVNAKGETINNVEVFEKQ